MTQKYLDVATKIALLLTIRSKRRLTSTLVSQSKIKPMEIFHPVKQPISYHQNK